MWYTFKRRLQLTALILVALAGSNAATYLVMQQDTKAKAIAHQCGQYNARSGAFEYVDAGPDLALALPPVIVSRQPLAIPPHKPKVD